MPAGGGPLRPRVAALAAALLLGVSAAAHAQEPLPVAPEQLEFLSRIDFHLDAAGMSEGDIQFHWATDLGTDVDLVDYVAGRLSIVARYALVLGDEFQPFDPNQSHYLLEASSSWRTPPVELALAFNHVSRHLNDRPRVRTVAWNTLRARGLRRLGAWGGTIDLRGDAGVVTDRSFVDYQWMLGGEATFTRAFASRVHWYARLEGESWGVDDLYDRSTQRGGRLESGLTLSGRGAKLDLFVGYEQVIDANPFELTPRRWPFAGFRLESR